MMRDLTTPQSISFARFWQWLQEHTLCILSCGSHEATLFDLEELHWAVFQDEDRRVVQLIRGKAMIGELLLPENIRDVQMGLHPETGAEGHHLFELYGESAEPFFHFVMAHGMEEAPQHKGFKH